MAPHDHVVKVYDDDSDLIDDVGRFLAAGLLAGEASVVVSTQSHRDTLARNLFKEGVAGRYYWFDAAETLSRFRTDDALSRERFVDVIGGIISAAGAPTRPVRVFGEMVALLWADGDVCGAIELEAMWNELAGSQRFSLYCAYPVDALTRAGDLVGMHQVCTHHSGVVAPRSYRSRVRTPKALDRGEESFELFVPVPEAAHAARRLAKDALVSWGDDARADEACLVASELTENAVAHARSPFRLSIKRSDGYVRIAVEDLSQDPPVLEPPDDLSAGKGLMVVAAVCNRWGVDAGPNGKTVWGELDLDTQMLSAG